MLKEKDSVLILTHFYFPAYKAGGPIRSIYNLYNLIEQKISVKILCSDRDIDNSSLNVNDSGNVIYKLKVNIFKLIGILRVESLHFNVLYINSFFDFRTSIVPLLLIKFGALDFDKIILAPRGELSIFALARSGYKKKAYLFFSRFLGLHEKIVFHSTSLQESLDIKVVFPISKVELVENVPLAPIVDSIDSSDKIKGSLRLCFVGRVNEHKNLLFALESIRKLGSKSSLVELSVFGTWEDEYYYFKCLDYVSEYNLNVNFLGAVPNNKLLNLLSEYDFMYLPSKSENFGHAIFESLSIGVPVIISDRTRFKGLEKSGCGYDVPVSSPDNFTVLLNDLIDIDMSTHIIMKQKALDFSNKFINDYEFQQEYLKLFNSGLGNV